MLFTVVSRQGSYTVEADGPDEVIDKTYAEAAGHDMAIFTPDGAIIAVIVTAPAPDVLISSRGETTESAGQLLPSPALPCPALGP